MGKTAVIFPGIGYHTDKPLLYYAGKLAASMGCEIIRISYPVCEVNLKEASREQILSFVDECLKTTSKALEDAHLSVGDDILFISKSIGTAIAAAYAKAQEYTVKHVFFTPLEETFEHILKGSGIAFNGTKDNWADCKRVAELCREYDIPLMTIDNANHSLETGAVAVDIANLDRVIKTVEDYLITV